MVRRRESRHWKLTDEAMGLFLQQLDLRLSTLSYADLAARTGMTEASARVTMWNLMQERHAGKVRVHRGTREVPQGTSKDQSPLAELRIE
jgi:hypothetical protein